jgi:hypothetical protein
MKLEVREFDFGNVYAFGVFVVCGEVVQLVYLSTTQHRDLRDGWARDMRKAIEEGLYRPIYEYTPEGGSRYWLGRVLRDVDGWLEVEKMTADGKGTRHIISIG